MVSIKNFTPKYNYNKQTFIEENNIYTEDGYLNTDGKFKFKSAHGYQSKPNVYGHIYFVEFITLIDPNTNYIIQLAHYGNKSATKGTWFTMETRTQKELLQMVQRAEQTVTYVVEH